MTDRVGVFTGAGLSEWAPAGIATGKAFHRRLRELCRDRSLPFTADLVDGAVLDMVPGNLLARIENTRPGTGAAALGSMRVSVPAEGHLLAALLLALGGLQVTVNFDEGVERAYALLSGSTELPAHARARFGPPLAAWRELWPQSAPALRVASRPGRIAPALGVHPLLVKLNGSLGLHADGVTLPFPPLTDEPDEGDLGGERRRALRALAAEGFVVVTGFSAADLASRGAVLEQLRPGRFLWMSAEIDPEVRRLVAAVDPDQPRTGQPVEALRQMLPLDPPAWPREPAGGPTFDERLDAWAGRLPAPVAAEALAWALADTGRADLADEILARLRRHDPSARTAVRLGEALVRRGAVGDAAAARRTWVRAALALPGDRPGRGVRGYALARVAESSVAGRRPPGPAVAAAGLLALAAVGAPASRAAASTAPVRTATIACGAVVGQLEAALPAVLRHRRRALARLVTGAAIAGAGRVMQVWAQTPSGWRRAALERQLVELVTMDALLRGAPAPAGSLTRLARLAAVFRHVNRPDGAAATAGTRALVHVSRGDPVAAHAALLEADRLDPATPGVARLARALLAAGGGPGAVRSG